MYKKFASSSVFWYLLFLFSLVPALLFFGQFLWKAFDYVHYSKQVIPHSINWGVTKGKNDTFFIQADYQYVFHNKKYLTKWVFRSESFPNPFLAQETIHLWQKRSWKAWINPRNPGLSILQKQMPYKLLLKSGICFLIFFYFMWLRFYSRMSSQKQ